MSFAKSNRFMENKENFPGPGQYENGWGAFGSDSIKYKMYMCPRFPKICRNVLAPCIPCSCADAFGRSNVNKFNQNQAPHSCGKNVNLDNTAFGSSTTNKDYNKKNQLSLSPISEVEDSGIMSAFSTPFNPNCGKHGEMNHSDALRHFQNVSPVEVVKQDLPLVPRKTVNKNLFKSKDNHPTLPREKPLQPEKKTPGKKAFKSKIPKRVNNNRGADPNVSEESFEKLIKNMSFSQCQVKCPTSDLENGSPVEVTKQDLPLVPQKTIKKNLFKSEENRPTLSKNKFQKPEKKNSSKKAFRSNSTKKVNNNKSANPKLSEEGFENLIKNMSFSQCDEESSTEQFDEKDLILTDSSNSSDNVDNTEFTKEKTLTEIESLLKNYRSFSQSVEDFLKMEALCNKQTSEESSQLDCVQYSEEDLDKLILIESSTDDEESKKIELMKQQRLKVEPMTYVKRNMYRDEKYPGKKHLKSIISKSNHKFDEKIEKRKYLKYKNFKNEKTSTKNQKQSDQFPEDLSSIKRKTTSKTLMKQDHSEHDDEKLVDIELESILSKIEKETGYHASHSCRNENMASQSSYEHVENRLKGLKKLSEGLNILLEDAIQMMVQDKKSQRREFFVKSLSALEEKLMNQRKETTSALAMVAMLGKEIAQF